MTPQHGDDTTPDTLTARLSGASRDSRRGFLSKAAATGGGRRRPALAYTGSTGALAHDAGDDDVSDVDVLNFALTLEHPENAFYRMGRERFSERDYRRSRTLRGFGSRIRNGVPGNLADVGAHEETHVETLTAVVEDLGGDPVAEADYEFGVSDDDEFLTTAAVLENTGVSAYDGAISLVGDADLLTAGATIATVEARHASYLNLLTGADPFPDAFDDPKTMAEILDAAGFIVDGA